MATRNHGPAKQTKTANADHLDGLPRELVHEFVEIDLIPKNALEFRVAALEELDNTQAAFVRFMNRTGDDWGAPPARARR